MMRPNFVLFNPGPVNLAPEIKARLLEVEYCHRQPEFTEIYDRTRHRLFDSFRYSAAEFGLGLLHGSGTLAVDAALSTFVRGRVLVVDNGLYSRRIATSLKLIGGTTVSSMDIDIGGRLTPSDLEEMAERRRPDWIAVVHHETTTGILNPLGSVAAIARGVGARLFVDAVSSIGAHDLAGLGDVVCFNSNKCLEALPGIAGVFWNRELPVHPTVRALDVQAHSSGMPSTPHVQAFVALDIALDLFSQEDRPARYARLANHLSSRLAETFTPLLEAQDRSNVLTSFRLGGRTIEDLMKRAAARRMVIYPGQEQLRDQIFRVANMGALIDEGVIDELADALA